MEKVSGPVMGLRADGFAPRATRDELEARVAQLEELVAAMKAACDAREDRVQTVEALVGGRNKSAPTKRNMTDADALAVLTGEFKGFAHKEAAERAGLTYAQVYSCRCEFTFKHVHKDLRAVQWRNPWSK